MQNLHGEAEMRVTLEMESSYPIVVVNLALSLPA